MNHIEVLAKKSSRKQIPQIFKQIPWVKGQRNLDWGGGKYDVATEWLKDEHGVINMVVDKFNRSKEHNDSVLVEIMTRSNHGNRKHPYLHTATLANVLNVIPNRSDRIQVLRDLHLYINQWSTTVYISCYDASGQPSVSECQTQMKLKDYLPEVEEVFNPWVHNKHEIELKNGMIIIHPRTQDW